MDKVVIYNSLVSTLADNWDTYKDPSCETLAKGVGEDGKGVYKGLPVVLTKFPCLGVMPADATLTPKGTDYCEDTDFRLEVYFYAFDFNKEQEATKLLYLSNAIEAVVRNFRELGGDVDRVRVEREEFAGLIRRSFEGSEFVVAGGIVTVLLSDFAKNL